MASEAQIAANRRNGALGRGPVTDDGKAKSRLNALKHGLTGAAIADSDALEVVQERKAQWARGFDLEKPKNEIAFHTLVVASVLSDRGFEAALIYRKEYAARAQANWDSDRRLAAESHAVRLSKAPGLVCRQLEETKQGVELMLERWEYLAASLESGSDWNESERSHALDLLGVPVDLRNGVTPVDALPGQGGLEYRKALVSRQIERLCQLVQSLGSLDAIQRDHAERGYLSEFTKAGQLIERYQKEANRRILTAYVQLCGPPPEPAPRSRGTQSVRKVLEAHLAARLEELQDREVEPEAASSMPMAVELAAPRVELMQPITILEVMPKGTMFHGSLIPSDRYASRPERRAAQAKARAKAKKRRASK